MSITHALELSIFLELGGSKHDGLEYTSAILLCSHPGISPCRASVTFDSHTYGTAMPGSETVHLESRVCYGSRRGAHSTIVRCASMRAVRQEDQAKAATNIAVIRSTIVGAGALSMKNET